MRIIITRPKNNNLLLEGRKENAAAMIVKKINDPWMVAWLQALLDPNTEDPDPLTDEDVEQLAPGSDPPIKQDNPFPPGPWPGDMQQLTLLDPTNPKFKYLEWIARRINEIARAQEDNDYLHHLKRVSEDPVAIENSLTRKPYPQDTAEHIDSLGPTRRVQAGYLTNAQKLANSRHHAREKITSAKGEMRKLRDYHRLAEKGYIEKDINKFKDLYNWGHEVYTAMQKEAERERLKKIEKGAKESTDYLEDDDNFMIVRPRSADSSCYYGQGTKWCISATQSRNYFDQYTGEGTGFYFVLFKHLPQEDVFKKLALVYTAGDSEEPSEVFDVTDDEVGIDALRDATEHNVLARALKKMAAEDLKKMKGPNRQSYYKNVFDDLIDEWDNLKQEEEGYKMPERLKTILNILGLDDEDLAVAESTDIQEHIQELVEEQYFEILGHTSGHFEENPAGPSDADFEALYEKHKYDYVYVNYDMYDESRWYWDASFSLDFTDIHDDLEDADPDEVENVLRKILDDYSTYPDEFDGYGTEVSVRFSPDYDENEGMHGFENFLNRMDDVDQALHKMMDSEKEDTIVAFTEAGLIAGTTVRTLKDRFDNLELDNFEIDIEDNELSIYKRLNITVPIPAHLYRGLTDDKPAWATENRADIKKSPALQAFDAMIKQRQSQHSDELIEQITGVFDKVFQLYTQKTQSTLPGFEGDTKDEDVLQVIEKFLKNIDREHMLERIRIRLETIVQNDVIKNIIPEFEEDGEAPEIDPRTGKVTSRAEREEAEKQKLAKEQAVDELSTMFENKKRLKILIKENVPFGGLMPGLAGQMGSNSGTTIMPHKPNMETGTGRDLDVSAKAVIHRNSKVLLIKNHQGWDLPGGHIKEDENIVSGLAREVFEETGLTLSQEDISSLNMNHRNKQFFCAELSSDDIQLSDEHYEYGFYTLSEVLKMDDIVEIYKKVIKKCLGGEDNIIGPKLKVVVTGHASTFQSSEPR